MAINDVFSQLARMSWRGIELPLTARSTSFTHENVQHKFQFRDNEIVEATGARNWTFSYTIPFREGIAVGPYRNLFSVTLIEFIDACRNREIGELVDPILGTFPARCTSFNEEADPNQRDGVTVRVEFIHSPDIGDVEQIVGSSVSIQGMANEAGALDEELTKIDYQEEEPPEPSIDPLSAINGFGRQLERQGNKISAALDDVAYRCEKIEATMDVLENPQNWPIRDSSRRVRDTALRIKSRAQDPSKNIYTVIQRYDQTISAVAANLNMTLPEFLRLNPSLAKNPLVPKGSTINFYR